MSTSALYNFGNHPQTPVQVLLRPASGFVSSSMNNTTAQTSTIITTTHARAPLIQDKTTEDNQLTMGSEKDLRLYASYNEVSPGH